MIYDVLNASVTESKLVDLLVLRYGSQVLAQKEIRNAIFLALEPEYQGYIYDGNFLDGRVLSQNERKNLDSQSWGRSRSSTKRLLNLFDLGDECFPPKEEIPPSVENIQPDTILFPYQRRVKDRYVRTLLGGADRLMLHMPTGAGKTRTCIEGLVDCLRAFSDRSGYVVWLAHSEELCEQAVETFKKIWSVRGDESIDVIRLWGKHPSPDFSNGSGFVVASLQRIHAMRLSRKDQTFIQAGQLKSKCRMVVIDEAHKAIAPTYLASIEFISNLDSTKILGLTATPGRGFEEDETKELVEFFHGNKITITDQNGCDVEDPIGYLQEEQYLAKIIRRAVATQVTVDLTEQEKNYVANLLDLPQSVLNRLADDAERNALIVAEIAALVMEGRDSIVFALSVEHAHLVAELLMLRGIEARCVDGSTSSYDRNKHINDYKHGAVRVLVNYGVLTTGFDAPNTNAVLIARPTGSLVLYSQMIGRGIRGKRMGGNLDCKLVDLKDNLIGFPNESMAFSYFDEAWGE
ncbi:Superfamily II DNA or RNA helicase [Mariprofundus ferrinatatus]|uniref:Superfamily II DNA or RNA helicase n=2 Tax=Mariprofundus ferrinatatus TaxID=1921087 RepID=A0A2K8L651_9PROT|nr:Superfamily II DNA or RNA helicase [Mariprofundus ferrinatatus]